MSTQPQPCSDEQGRKTQRVRGLAVRIFSLACAPRFVADAGLHSRHLRGVAVQRRAVLSSHDGSEDLLRDTITVMGVAMTLEVALSLGTSGPPWPISAASH